MFALLTGLPTPAVIGMLHVPALPGTPRAGAAVRHGTAVTYVVATPRPLHGKQDRRRD